MNYIKQKLHQLKTWINVKIREKLWPNWVYHSEYRDAYGTLFIVFEDPKYPQFRKELKLVRRKDTTKDSYATGIYNYEPMQLGADWVLKDVKLHTGRFVDIKASVVIHKDQPVDAKEVRRGMGLSSSERLEVRKILETHKYLS